ncbi:MAG: AraC family transcriptional regulator [Brevundimonas sp.]|nr:MAG: AraC family transcriptional regulator [Brevundimonas sp.]
MRTPDRFEDHGPMKLAGHRRTYVMAEAPTQIPMAWRAFVQTLPLPGQRGPVTYGAVGGADMQAGSFDYLCGVEVEDFATQAPDAGKMQVPAARYAVFIHAGPTAAIRDTIEAAHHWLDANATWIDGHSPSLERYGPDFDVVEAGDTEIWLPVVPAESTSP